MIDSKTVFTVGQLTRSLNDWFRADCRAIRIRGEVASITCASSGHWYFGLKDESAHIKAVMFRPRNVLAGFRPKVGDQVEVLAQLAVYEQRGELQLVVDVIKQSGQGSLYEQFVVLKAKLTEEGLFAAAHKRPLPRYVFNVGVVTSLQAAALADVRHALARRCPHIRHTVYHTAVQGEGAAEQIVSALQQANQARHDVLILCRGGGSLEDLWAFNLEVVVRAVADSPTTIVVGVGHETDVALAEFAADLRAATPTAAAELISLPTQQILGALLAQQDQLHRRVRQHIQAVAQRIDRAEFELITPSARVDTVRHQVELSVSKFESILHRKLQQFHHHLLSSQVKLSAKREAAEGAAHGQLVRLAQHVFHQRDVLLSASEARLSRLDGVLNAVSPARTLRRGYAYLQSVASGAIVSSVAHARAGDELKAQLNDGEMYLVAKENPIRTDD